MTIAAALCAALLVVLLAAEVAKRKAISMNCRSHVRSICFGARLWAQDNGGRLPPNLLWMSNYVNAPKILICPGDPSNKPTTGWGSFTAANSSYEIVTPGLSDADSKGVFLRCKIHGFIGYADGRVSEGPPK